MQKHSKSNVKDKWLSLGKSVSLKRCKMTFPFLFLLFGDKLYLKPLSKTALLADRHILNIMNKISLGRVVLFQFLK